MLRLFFSIPILLTACLKDETISGFVDQTAVFQLTEINGTAFAARATLAFPQQGQVSGKAPCNSYVAEQTAPYPWFELGPIRSTRSTCADIEIETAFFEQLRKMTLIEAVAEILILRNDDGDEMVFKISQE